MAFGDAYEDGEFVLLEVEVGAVMGVTVYYSFSCPGGYFTIDFDFSNSPIVSLTVLRIAAATTFAFPFEGEYCVNCKISFTCRVIGCKD